MFTYYNTAATEFIDECESIYTYQRSAHGGLPSATELLKGSCSPLLLLSENHRVIHLL